LTQSRGRAATFQQPPQRHDAVERQGIVAHGKPKLMPEISQPVNDRGSGYEERRSADQPPRGVGIAFGVTIPEMMTLINDDQASGSAGKPPPACLLVRADPHRNVEAVRHGLPLRQERRGNQARSCAGTVECRGNRQSYISLSTPHRIGQHSSVVLADSCESSAEALQLLGE
jgi:hypothetical protein